MSSKNILIHKLSWKLLILSKGRWYIFSSLFTKGLSILLVPIYTRYLSPADFGILNILNSIGQFLPIIISLYIDSAFGRYFHEDKIDHSQLKKLFSTSYWFVAIYGGFVITLALIASSVWAEELERMPFSYLLLTFIPALLIQLGQLGTVYLRQSLDSQRSTLLEVGAAILSIGVTIPLLVFFNAGIMAKLIGGTVSSFSVFFYYTVFFWRRDLFRFEFDFHVLKRSLMYSTPLLPSIAGGWISGMSDRLILAKYASVESVGVYSLAASLATILYVLQDAVTQVTGPIAMSGLIHDYQATLKKIARLSLVLWATMLFADFTLILFSKEIIYIFATKAYSGAAPLIGICAFAYVISPQYRIFIDVLSYHKKMSIVAIAGILSAIVSVALNIFLIPRYGYFATAWAFVISTGVMTAWIICWSKYYESIPVLWGKCALLTALFLIASGLMGQISAISIEIIFIKILSAFLFLGAVFYIVNYKKLDNL